MENQEIYTLLDRYFEGISTLQEERQLKAFFRKEENMPDDLLAYQPLFKGLEEAAKVTLPTSVEEELLAAIKAESKPKVRSISYQYWWRYAAAVALLVFGMTWWWNTNPQAETTAGIDWSQYEPESPEEAARLYQQAVLKLSSALNQGANSAAKNVKRVETVGQFFE